MKGDIEELDPPSCPDGELRCLTCHAHNDKDCYMTGRYRRCTGENDVCYHETQEAGGVRRGCIDIKSCPAAALGLTNYFCNQDTGKCLSCANGIIPKGDLRLPDRPRAQCRNPPYAICYCRGDPHCSDYDQNIYNGMNAGCWNVMSMDGCGDNSTRTFKLLIKIIELINRPDKWMVEEIRIYDYLNGVQTLCLMFGQMNFKYSDDYGATWNMMTDGLNVIGTAIIVNNFALGTSTIVLPSGIVIFWDYKNTVTSTAPEFYKGKLCGICGNFDGDPDTGDYVYGPSQNAATCPALQGLQSLPEGSPPGNQVLFLMSWFHNTSEDPTCVETCAG